MNVPKKFKKSDGSVNVDAMAKSYAHLEEGVNKRKKPEAPVVDIEPKDAMSNDMFSIPSDRGRQMAEQIKQLEEDQMLVAKNMSASNDGYALQKATENVDAAKANASQIQQLNLVPARPFKARFGQPRSQWSEVVANQELPRLLENADTSNPIVSVAPGVDGGDRSGVVRVSDANVGGTLMKWTPRKDIDSYAVLVVNDRAVSVMPVLKGMNEAMTKQTISQIDEYFAPTMDLLSKQGARGEVMLVSESSLTR